MEILLVTLIVLSITFLFDLTFRRIIENRPLKFGRYKIHHSVFGVLLFAAGVVVHNPLLLSIGLGMYLSHGLEEMYFERTRFPAAFFVFVTRSPSGGRAN